MSERVGELTGDERAALALAAKSWWKQPPGHGYDALFDEVERILARRTEDPT